MVYQRTNAWMLALGLPLLLAGCASHSCDEPMSGEQCREERLLYQNDMLQAKMLAPPASRTTSSWPRPCSAVPRRKTSAARCPSTRRC